MDSAQAGLTGSLRSQDENGGESTVIFHQTFFLWSMIRTKTGNISESRKSYAQPNFAFSYLTWQRSDFLLEHDEILPRAQSATGRTGFHRGARKRLFRRGEEGHLKRDPQNNASSLCTSILVYHQEGRGEVCLLLKNTSL